MSQSSSSEKRVLWEIRRRYDIDDKDVSSREPAHAQVTRRRRATVTPTSTASAPRSRRLRKTQRSRHWGRRLFLIFFLLLAASSGVFGYKILAAGNKISATDTSILTQLKDLLFNSGETLAGEGDGRVNVLLLGIGGEGHSGQNLADSVIVASIRPTSGDVALLSIPRDLYVQVPDKEYYTKINSVHAHGESLEAGQGPVLMVRKVKEITGLPIHYYARIDFPAFKSLVDAVGGVNITIENSFFDYWHKISFPAGTEHMNGERALAYVRARYVEGPEGGDFRRGARQQQVLLALREKIFSVNTALDFGTLTSILNSLSDDIRTDMELWEMKRFFELSRLINPKEVKSVVLDTGHNGVLVGGTELLGDAPAAVLRPRTGDYSEIQAIAANIFSDEVGTNITATPASELQETPASDTAQPESAEAPEEELPILEIRNGTNITGLAKQTSDSFEEDGYTVAAIGNAATRDRQETVVYALKTSASDGAQQVAEILEAEADTGLPEGEAESSADVLIILGTDADKS